MVIISYSQRRFVLISRPSVVLLLLLWLTVSPSGQAHLSATTNTNTTTTTTTTNTTTYKTNVFANDRYDEDDHVHRGGCGAHALSMKDEQIQQLRVEQQKQHQQPASVEENTSHGRRRLLFPSCHELCHQCISVPIRLHLLVTELSNGDESSSPISTANVVESFRRNLQLLNQAFRETPFVFEWDDVYRLMPHPHATWNALEFREWIGGTHQQQSDDSTLHVYLAHQLAPVGTDGGILFGFSTFPSAQTVGDGVYLRYDVLTGGGWPINNMDLGYWLIHETGHWLGLLHSFQTYLHKTPELYNCQLDEADFGDFVSDTPLQRGPSVNQDCKAHLGEDAPVLDTCPNLPGPDPLFNYMNYVDGRYNAFLGVF